MKLVLKLLFISVLFGFSPLYAVEVKALYEVEVLSKSEQPADKKIAIQRAMKVVLSRLLSGEEDLWKHQMVKNILRQSEDYVDEFQYALVTIELHNVHARLMRILFDDTKLVNRLRQGNIALWNEMRPRTLVWLVVEQAGKQQFFDSVTMPDIDLAMTIAAKQYALPLLYPIQDLEEQQALSIADVLSAYSDHLLNVSTRYEVMSTLAGTLVDKGSCWQSEWSFYFDSKIMQWRSPCLSLNEAVLYGVNRVYQRLSAYYSVMP